MACYTVYPTQMTISCAPGVVARRGQRQDLRYGDALCLASVTVVVLFFVLPAQAPTIAERVCRLES